MDDNVRQSLEAPLDRQMVEHCQAGGNRMVPYLAGHTVIDQANRIFGRDAWSMWTDHVDFRETGTRTDKNGNTLRVGIYTAKVSIEALDRRRSGVGTTTCLDLEDADEHDKAIKGAETDAMKRAFRTFGAQFGNGLYGTPFPQAQPAQQQRGHGHAPPQPTSGPRESEPDRAMFGKWANAANVDQNHVEQLIGKRPTWENIRAHVTDFGIADNGYAICTYLARQLSVPTPAQLGLEQPASTSPRPQPAQQVGRDPAICPQCGGGKNPGYDLCRDCQDQRNSRYVPCPNNCGNNYDPSKYNMCRDCEAA